MTLVIALAYSVQWHWRRRLAFRNRAAPHVFVESRRREYEDQLNRGGSSVRQAHPSFYWKKDHSTRVNLVILVIQTNAGTTGLQKQDFILSEMPMLGNHPARRNRFCSKDKMLRAAVLRSDLQDKLGCRIKHLLARSSDALLTLISL